MKSLMCKMTYIYLVFLFAIRIFSQTPELTTPSNGQTNVPINYAFQWSEVPGATYHLEISYYSSFYWSQINVANLTNTSYSVTGLYMYCPYFWRVSATTASGTTTSEVRSFTTGSSTGIPTAPTLSVPANNSSGVATSLSFIWNYLSGVTYHLQVSTSSSFTNNIVDVNGLAVNTHYVSGLSENTNYYWRVGAIESGQTTFSNPWQFSTLSTSGGGTAPVLISPADNTADIPITNTFYWNSVTGATSYRLQISSTSNFSVNIVDQSNITNTNFQVTNLAYSTNYFWRVGAVSVSGTAFSDSRNFSTGLPGGPGGNAAPELLSPTNGATNVFTNPAFTWEEIEGATYRIQIATSNYFGAPQIDVSNLTDPTYSASGLYMVTPYYWRVNATTSEGTSDWSAVSNFVTGYSQSSAPAAPVLASPVNGASGVSISPTLQWNISSNASSYGLQVSTNSSFNSFVINQSGITGTTYNLTDLNTGTTYYWRVNATNSAGTSSWSGARSFTTINLPVITLTTPEDNLLTADSIFSVTGSVNIAVSSLKINYDSVYIAPDFSFSKTLTLTEGNNIIRITARNNSGDSVTVIRNVKLDSTPPVITFTESYDSLVTKIQLLEITGNISDSTTISMKINSDSVYVNSTGEFSHNLILTEGKNNIIISVVDEAGNILADTLLVTLDTIKPELSITSVVINEETADSLLVTVNGTYSDSTKVELTINGKDPRELTDFTFIGLVTLLPGENSITVIAKDEAENADTIVYAVDWNPVILPPDPATVAPPLDPTVVTSMFDATSFLYTGENPIQTGVEEGTIEARRVAVLRGRTLKRDNTPLSGVTVTLLNHDEFGQTLTRADGWFDMAVNGGGYLTLKYEKEGYLSAQRTIDTPWRDYQIADDVVLIQLDTAVTTIDFSEPIQVAQGSVVTDEDGTRQATLMFKQGTTAIMELPDGSTQTLSSINVRATEYTVGENGPLAMPAELPPATGYTYCAELSVDEAISAEAKKVTFSAPVAFYVDNFLNFPIGTKVPVGYYDREQAKWIAVPDGKVIRLLDIDQGFAQLDTDGDNLADDIETLSEIGIDSLEQQSVAQSFNIGESFWRSEIKHFTPWDCNWPYGPPMDAEPNSSKQKNKNVDENDKSEKDCGSVINIENQTLGESVPIIGTPFSLSYSSALTEESKFNYQVPIKLCESTFPASLRSVKLIMKIAGHKFEQDFEPTSNLIYNFTWDGNDNYGRRVEGRRKIEVEIGYEYDRVYYRSNSNLAASFGRLGQTPITSVEQRSFDPYFLWRKWSTSIGSITRTDFGGWNPSIHHNYDVVSRTLYLGDGTIKNSENASQIISTLINFSDIDISGAEPDENSASCSDIDVTSDGSIYILDSQFRRILKRDTNGNIYLIKQLSPGGGIIVSSAAQSINSSINDRANKFKKLEADAGIKKQSLPSNKISGQTIKIDTRDAQFVEVLDTNANKIAVDNNGTVYFTDRNNNRVYKIDETGTAVVVAGTGEYGYSGDGGPATGAELYGPTGITIASDGTIFFADADNSVIRSIGTDGIIETFAGNGDWGNYGDGGNALEAALMYVEGIDIGNDGSLYFADAIANRVRKISPDGKIMTIAGNGPIGHSSWEEIPNDRGDGGLAIEARLISPSDVAVSKDGTVYIADTYAHHIRKVTPEGIINRIAGKYGEKVYQYSPNDDDNGGFNFEIGPSPATRLSWPVALSTDANDNLYSSDIGNGRLRKINRQYTNFEDNEVVIGSGNSQIAYVFGSDGKHRRTINTLTGKSIFEFKYNNLGLLSSIIDIDSMVTTFERDTSGVCTSIISPFGIKTELVTDTSHHLISLIDQNQDSTNFVYSNGGLLLENIDPKRNIKKYFYDIDGRFVREEYPNGGYTEISRSDIPDGFELTKTTAENNLMTYRYETFPDESIMYTSQDAAGLITKRIYATDGSLTTITPSGIISTQISKPDPQWGMESPLIDTLKITLPDGLQSIITQDKTIYEMTGDQVTGIESITTINGKQWISDYNANYEVILNISPENRYSAQCLDSLGRITCLSIYDIEPVNYSYNDYGQLTGITQGYRTSTFTYDSRGRLSTITDPMQRTEVMQYDSIGRITKQILPNTKEINYSYDANGNLISIQPPGKPLHLFDYDNVNLNNLYSPPDTSGIYGSIHYVYDLDKRLTHILRPDSLNIILEYDSTGCNCGGAGKLSKISYPGGFTDYEYHPENGLLTSVFSSSGISNEIYYNGSLPIRMDVIDYSIPSNPVTQGILEVDYNNDFRIISQRLNQSNTVNFNYDNDGLITLAGDLAINYNLDNGLLTGTALNQITDSYEYNNFGEITNYNARVGTDTLYNLSFALDSLGRIASKTEVINDSTISYEYSYNTIGYLTKVEKNGIVTNEYQYDDNGNRTRQLMTNDPSSPGGYAEIDTLSATYDEQDRMLTYGSAQYFYTPAGNLSMKIEGADTTHYTYDAFGNLLNVSLPNGDMIEYIIEGMNRRIAKKLNSQIVKKWLYMNQLNPMAELDSNNNVLSCFVYGTKINVPDYIIKGDSTYKVITDHLGSVRLVVNSLTGNIAQEIEYDEYGNILGQTGSFDIPFGFAGGLYDEQTELVRFGARDYDSEIGRWTAKDATLFRGGTSNIYEYCLNNPVNYVDINGKHFLKTHYIMTFRWALQNGYSISEAHKFGTASVMADLIKGQSSTSSEITKRHAMAGELQDQNRFQTKDEALNATQNFIDEMKRKADKCKEAGQMNKYYEYMGYALHAQQDISAILHNGSEWHDTLFEKGAHMLTEAFPSLTIPGYDILIALLNN